MKTGTTNDYRDAWVVIILQTLFQFGLENNNNDAMQNKWRVF